MEHLKAFKNPVYWSIVAGITLAFLFSMYNHIKLIMTYDKNTIRVANQEYVKETTRWSGHTHTNYIPVEYALHKNSVGVRLSQRTNPLFRFYVERYHRRNKTLIPPKRFDESEGASLVNRKRPYVSQMIRVKLSINPI